MGKVKPNSSPGLASRPRSKNKKLRKSKLKKITKKRSSDKTWHDVDVSSADKLIKDDGITGNWKAPLSNKAEAIQERKRIKSEKKKLRTPKNINEKKSLEAIEYIANWKDNRFEVNRIDNSFRNREK